MSWSTVSWYIFTFTLLESFLETHLTVHDNSHGFINHEKYFMNDLNSYHEGFSIDARSPTINDLNLKYLLKFEPEFLDFKQRPLGVPHLEKVTLHNVHGNRSIDMTSISGSTVHFHSSFFEDKKIPPLGNTTFNVVFLGRGEGAIESDLFIHTTEGRFKYQVKGASVYSPYRLRPIVGIKLPLNATFSPFIYMHNPHTEAIQIVEVYSSGGDFHLELPTGELEGPKDMWEIPSFQTKAIIRVRFQARTEQNHTAYVRIKLNNTEEVLVVPLEVEVTSSAGLFEPQGSVDFGVGGSLDLPKKIKLYIQNPLKKAARIHSVTTSSKAIKVDYENIRIPADSRNKNGQLNSFEIATLTLDWSEAFKTKDFCGKIIVKYKNGKSKTEIPYYMTVLEGGLSYDPSVTRYFINETPEVMQSRVIKIKNDFLSPVMIINVSLAREAENYFELTDVNTVILKPKEELNVVTLRLKNGVCLSDVKVNSHIIVKTNISDVLIPLLSYNGKLELHLPFKSKDNSLDLGLISMESKKDVHMLILNRNPVGINIKNIKTSIPSGSVEIVGCFSGNYSAALLQDVYKNSSKCTILQTDHYAIIRLTVKSFSSEGQIWGDITVETQYEQLSIPVHFKIAQGKLELGPDRLVFDQCFPGKICSHPLRVHSTFNEPMVIENILTIPPDPRISSKHSGHILARATKVIGHLYLDPNLACANECYCGLQHDTTAQWLKTLQLPEGASEFDLNLVNVFYNRYLNQTSNGMKKWQNLTLRLDTSEVRGHLFKTRVKMSWPSLLIEQNVENKSVFVFPLTQVYHTSYRNITIKNPSSYNLVVQIVMDRNYPDLESLYEGVPPSFMPGDLKKDFAREFRFHAKQHTLFQHKLNLKFHEDTIPVLLSPGENFTFTVAYKVAESGTKTAAIFLRNNLTILEVVKLVGRGAHPSFKFGNRRPGSLQPLSFELTEKHLKDCEREKHRKYPSPNLTVKRSFTARNTGDIPIFIHNFYISGMSCEGYGFKVLNCEPFQLLPNATRKIDIAFTPDFTLAKITRTLVLETSLNVPVSYTLVTTVPSYYLSLCSSVITRPHWETYLYYTAVCLMCFLLIFVALAPVMDSERILKQALGLVIARNCPSTQPTLDLRLVGQQTRSEIRQKAESDATEKACKEKEKKTVEEATKEKTAKEPEKYMVLIPTTGKQKKKLAKKSSNELTSSDLSSMQKKNPGEIQKPQKVKTDCKTDTEAEIPCKKHLKEPKKFVHKPLTIKHIDIPVCEEETSSTTTESSSNNEETDKEIHKNPKIPPKKQSPNAKTQLNPPNISAETISTCESLHSEVASHAKLERRRSGPKANRNKEYKHRDPHEKSENKPRGNKNQRERKEKQLLAKKLSKPLSDPGNSSPSVRVSPSAPASSFWGENRAKFSDVVARSENAYPVTSSRSFVQTGKPTVYVEPYKNTNTELGPIGSKKIDYWQDSVQVHNDDQYGHLSNSFFTDAHALGVESSNAFLDVGVPESNWEGGNSNLMNLMQQNGVPQISSGSGGMQGGWTQSSSNGFWDSIYSPLNEPAARSQSGYLWGSSPVWQPWAPETPKTPTRTPPGFAPQSEIEERKQQHSHLYSPFDMGNIWTQQQSNPWDYQQQEQ